MSYPSEFIPIFARNCSVKRIDAAAARAFLQANHRFGFSRSRYHYGLFIEKTGGGMRDASGHDIYPIGTLVAAGSFSTGRRWQKEEGEVCSYEWVRYASLEGVRVLGGMGKILNCFIDEVQPDDVMTYAPLDAGDEGDVYLQLGFKPEGIKEFPGGRSAKYRLKTK